MNDAPIDEMPLDESPMPEMPDRDTRMWAMFCHLAGLALLIGIPAANILGPLIIWQMKKEQHPFIDVHGKESMNFQISMFIYGLVAALLIFVCVGMVLLPALVVVDIVFVVIAGIKANDGQAYRYPLTIRLIK